MFRTQLALVRFASCSNSAVVSIRNWSNDRFANARTGGFGGRIRNNYPNSRQGDFGGRRDAFDAFNLPEVDAKNFEPIQKDFYQEHPNVTARSQEEINNWINRHEFQLNNSKNVARPIFTFEEAGFPEPILNYLQKHYEKPTPIQSVSWPNALKGRDLISIAQTGSGKTLGFILPGIVHSLNQSKHDSPNVLVITPTRELCQQVFQVSGKIARIMGLKMAIAFGGQQRRAQEVEIRARPKIIVATPGRLMDFIKMQTLDVSKTSYVVLDEADRMLDMGFMPQITNILKSIRHDRQLSMFSATWPKEVRELARRFINDPVHLSGGSTELRANPSIKQEFIFYDNEHTKFEQLFELIKETRKDPASKVLIFTSMKRSADNLMFRLRGAGLKSALGIHGDKSQKDRDFAMHEFRKSACRILIATDVAARGIDVADISHVINYDMPNNIEDYIHRIGRTARGDRKGVAVTFVNQALDLSMHSKIVQVLEEVGQPVPKEFEAKVYKRASGSNW